MKKLSILLVLCLVMSLLAACGAGTNPTTTPTTEPTTESTEAPTTAPTTEPVLETMPSLESDGIHVQFPEGFVSETTGQQQVAIGPNVLEGDASNVILMTIPVSGPLTVPTEEEMMQSMGYGYDEGTTTIHQFQVTEVDGYPTVRLEYEADMEQGNVYVTMLMIFGSDAYALVYQDATADRSWTDAFETSIATINVLEPGEVAPTEPTEPVDPAELETYDLHGLTMQAQAGLINYPVDGYDACYLGETVGIMSLSESKTDLGLTDWSLEHYAEMVAESNGLEPFTQDSNGNWWNSYTATGSDYVPYYYYLTVREDNDAFYLIQVFCPEADSAAMAPVIAQWASTLTLAE